jgi:hypothetical protein
MCVLAASSSCPSAWAARSSGVKIRELGLSHKLVLTVPEVLPHARVPAGKTPFGIEQNYDKVLQFGDEQFIEPSVFDRQSRYYVRHGNRLC